MNYRVTEVLDEKSLTTTGTEIIPINVKDIISRLNLTWRISASKHGMDSYQHKDITKIELVDGSDVLFGMDGGQCQALCIYDRKVPTMNYGQHMQNSSQFANFGIDFGRFLYDPVLALDPGKFRNLVLKVTYDVDVADTGVTTGYLEVRADCFDEKVISPVGFLMSKEHFKAGTPDSGYTYVDLPTDHPYRKLLVQGYHKEYEPWYVIASAKLNEDNGKRIPFDWNMETYYRRMMAVWEPVEEVVIGQTVVAGLNYYVTPTDYWVAASLMSRSGDQRIYGDAVTRGGKLNLKSSAASCPFMGQVRGYLPNHCFEFPFGDPMDIDDWYDVTALGSLRLRLEEGTHHDDQRQAVVIQQLRRY